MRVSSAEPREAPSRTMLLTFGRASAPVRYFIQIVLVLAISADVTIISAMVMKGMAWRFTLVLLSMVMVIAVFHLPRVASQSVRQGRVIPLMILLLSPYILFLLVEGFSAIVTGTGMITVRQACMRLMLIVPALLGMCVMGGGVTDLKEGLRFILRPYVFVCLVVSLLGLLAWGLIYFQVVDAASWKPPPGFSEGLAYRDRLGGGIFSMPLYLGLVLVGGSGDSMVIGAFRASGLSEEPHHAALFVTPALFAIPFVFDRSSAVKKVLLASVILTFLAVVWSVSNVLIMVLIAGLILAKWATRRTAVTPVRLLMLFPILFFGYVAVTTFFIPTGQFTFIIEKIFGESGAATLDLHRVMWSSNALVGMGIFHDSGQALGDPGIFSSLTFWFQGVVFLSIGLHCFFSRRDSAFLGLALIYVVLHSLKDPGHILAWPIYLYVIFIGAMAVSFPNRKKGVALGSVGASPPAEPPRWRAVTGAQSLG